MLASLIKGVLGPLMNGVLRLIPDKNKRAEAKEQFEGQILIAMTSLVAGQIAINLKEAEHGSVFVAGWRPFIGWTCGSGLAWSFVIAPMIRVIAWAFGVDVSDMPVLDVGPLLTLVLGMLGLGGLRTYEKKIGVARTDVKK